MNRIARIAGVTFANEAEDGGENRQKLLEQLATIGPTLVTLVKTIYNNPETGEAEDAIKVYSDALGKVIGWIPREKIKDLWNTEKLLLCVEYYKDTFGGQLAEIEPPSAKQYKIMQAMLAAKKIKSKPPYDKIIYGYWIERVNKAYMFA